jgi:hypothetical protein|tara:strand:- start:5236 stop:5394 length:159 start_codon:yes stop_codon:yes gene_type:complete
MPHIFKSFRKSNLKTRKVRKPRNLLDVTKMKPVKMPTPIDIFGADLKPIQKK